MCIGRCIGYQGAIISSVADSDQLACAAVWTSQWFDPRRGYADGNLDLGRTFRALGVSRLQDLQVRDGTQP